jgi:hypothetical protein
VARECIRLGAEVTGVDLREPLPGAVTRFLRVDLEREPLGVEPSEYDGVLLLDVIEHFSEPERFLLELRNRSHKFEQSKPPPVVLISTPNVVFASLRLSLLLGRFSYAERGILDITHKRLFTRVSLLRMLADCGFSVEETITVPVPFEAVLPNRFGRVLARFSSLAARAWPTLFGFQFLVVCRPRPSVGQILASTGRHHVAARSPLASNEEEGAPPVRLSTSRPRSSPTS